MQGACRVRSSSTSIIHVKILHVLSLAVENRRSCLREDCRAALSQELPVLPAPVGTQALAGNTSVHRNSGADIVRREQNVITCAHLLKSPPIHPICIAR